MNCPDCDAQLYGDLSKCRCGWTKDKKPKRASNEDELLPLVMRPCAYCGKPNVGTVNGKSACNEHFPKAMFNEPITKVVA